MGKGGKKAKLPLKRVLIYTTSSILFPLFLALGGYLFLQNRIYPGVFIANLNLSAKTPFEAQQDIDSLLAERTTTPLTFLYKGQVYSLDLSSLQTSIDSSKLANNAFLWGHSKLYFSPQHLPLISSLNSNIELQIQEIARTIDQPAVDSSLTADGNEISVTPSQEGFILDQDALTRELITFMNTGQKPPKELPIKQSLPKLTYTDALAIKAELDQLKSTPLLLNFKDKSYTLDLPTILSLMDLQSDKSVLLSGDFFGNEVTLSSINTDGSNLTQGRLSLNQEKLQNYLAGIAQGIDRGVKEPLLNYDPKVNNGIGKVTEFQPPQEGWKLNIEKTAEDIQKHLIASDFSPVTLSVDITPPKNELVNQLGIKELLGEGVSHFAHSIPNRVYNVELAASRVNGTLVPPGGIFSFNQAVGEVSGATGYKEGYIISGGKTVLDDGGGVCQDSTTLFRAVLNAGLPVVARTAHAYRVGYYEQDSPPGLDATVFAPSVDFKFKNDTNAYILIQTRVENDDTLYYDLYGTSDGRVATVTTPVILSTSPALPDIRQDDPTLPKGQVKQVDFAVAGANVVFSRTVTRNGQTLIQETYHSNYHPWANIFLVGTQ